MDSKQIAALIRRYPHVAERLAIMAADAPSEYAGDAASAAGIVAPHLTGLAYESLACVALNRRNRVIAVEVLASGGSDCFAIVCPRRIYRWALMQGKSGAASIILAHNHPSGDTTPSPQDYDVTRKVKQAGAAIGIPLLDHIVIADAPGARGYNFASIRETNPLGW